MAGGNHFVIIILQQFACALQNNLGSKKIVIFNVNQYAHNYLVLHLLIIFISIPLYTRVSLGYQTFQLHLWSQFLDALFYSKDVFDTDLKYMDAHLTTSNVAIQMAY